MERISAWQIGVLVFLLRFSQAIVSLTPPKYTTKGPDAWIGALIGTLVGLGIVWLIATTAVLEPNRTPIERWITAIGPVLGRIAGAIYVGIILLNTMLTVRMYGGLLISQPMPETPVEAFVVLLAAGACYAAWHGLEVTARVGEVVMPLVLVGVGVVFLLASREMDPRALKPVLGWGWWPPIRTSFTTMALHFELLCAGFLLSRAANPKAGARAALIGAAAAGVLIIGGSASIVMFYGSEEARRITFPLYDLARSVTVGDFLERMDPLFMLIWTMGSFVKVSTLLWTATLGLTQLLGLRERRPLVMPLTLFCILTSLLLYDSQAEVTTLFSPQVLPWAVGPFLLGIPGVLALVELVQRQRGMAP